MKALKLFGLLLLLGLLGLSFPGNLDQAGQKGLEITVCPQGPPQCDFSKIQEAIDAAPEGATIRVGEGTYVESLIIRKSLRLIGAGQEKVRISTMPQKPPASMPAIVIEATEEPIQVWVEGLSIGERDAVPPDLKYANWGIYIAGWAQVVLKRTTISGYGFGLFVAAREGRKEFHFAILKPQVIILEANISHNLYGVAIASLVHPIQIWRTTITENEVGIFSGEFTLDGSIITKNRKAGIWVSLLPPSWLERSIVRIENNLISENGVGVLLFSGLPLSPPPEPKPEDVKPLAVIPFNRIVGNLEYGLAIQTARCLALGQYEAESAPIQVEGWSNEMWDNGKGDLCPTDYPWPPNFKRP